VAVLLSAGDQRMTMSFGPRARDEPAAGETLQGFNDVYKARIEWRIAREAGGHVRPFATIVRWNTFLLDEGTGIADASRPKTIDGKVLVVTRLGPHGVCHVGYVDALANPDAEALARKIADRSARSFLLRYRAADHPGSNRSWFKLHQQGRKGRSVNARIRAINSTRQTGRA
jgi:hypothetical protein